MRTKEEIQKEYESLALVVGDKSYKIACLQSEINEHYKKMLELNQEHAKIIAPEVPKDESN